MGVQILGDGDQLTLVAPSAGVTKDVPAQIGGLWVLPLATASSGEKFPACTRAECRVAKASGALTLGQPLPWDVADAQVNSDYITNDVPLVCIEAALSGDAYVRALLDAALARGSVQVVSEYIQPLANATAAGQIRAPFAGKVIAGYYRTGAKGSSSSGGLTMSANNPGVSGNNVLSAASVNLETATDDSTTALTLTSTAADLVVAANGVIEVKIVSDNADLVAGEGVQVWFAFQRT